MKISTVTVAVWLAFAPAETPAPQPAPVKCCGKCGGTGMVPTGDGITRVWCECPKTCPCAEKRPKPASAQCKDGKCNAR
jgi:hypothetical protein